MPNALLARGVAGELRKGYQVAVRLGAWTLSGDTVEAAASEVHPFWLEQAGACGLRLHVGQKAWSWREVEVLATTPSVRVRVVGSPDVRDQ